MGAPEDESSAVARSLRRRDPDVVDHLIDRYHYRLFRYLLSLSHNRQAAEDVFQETWIRVLERGHLYNGQSRFDTWLFAVARHLMIDRLRRERPHVSIEALLDAGEKRHSSARSVLSDVPAPDECSSMEDRQWVEGALESIPAVYREALVLRYQEELPLEQISRISAAPLSTVKSRIYRGLEMLRELLDRRRQ